MGIIEVLCLYAKSPLWLIRKSIVANIEIKSMWVIQNFMWVMKKSFVQNIEVIHG